MTNTEIYLLRASLRPKLYRDIEILRDKKLYALAEAITQAFGFDFDHAFGFYSKLKGHIYDSPVKYELFADMGEAEGEARSVKRTRIADAFPSVGTKMTFLFDYGDGWQFNIALIGQTRKESAARYPRVIKSVGEAPEQYPDPDDDADEYSDEEE